MLTTASATIDGIVALASYGKRSGISGDADKYAVSADVFGLYEAASANTVMPGDSCRIVVEFTPKDGYGFADPEKTTVKAKINGKNAVLYDYFDGSILFYIDYYISYCNIAKVDFDYDEPFVGESDIRDKQSVRNAERQDPYHGYLLGGKRNRRKPDMGRHERQRHIPGRS